MRLRKRNKTVKVVLPDGERVKMQIFGRSVKEHNRIVDRCNAIFDIVNSTTPDDPNPITPEQEQFVLSTLPEGSEYKLTEDGWGFW